MSERTAELKKLIEQWRESAKLHESIAESADAWGGDANSVTADCFKECAVAHRMMADDFGRCANELEAVLALPVLPPVKEQGEPEKENR